MVMRWLRSETIAMIGSPALPDSMAAEPSLRPLTAPAWSALAINRARPASARRAVRNLVRLGFGSAKQDVIAVGASQLAPGRDIAPFGRPCQLGTAVCLWAGPRKPSRP